MGVIEQAKVLGLGRIGDADLAGLDVQVGLPQAAALDEDLDCAGGSVQLRGRAGDGALARGAARTRRSVLWQDERVPPFGEGACGGHGDAEWLISWWLSAVTEASQELDQSVLEVAAAVVSAGRRLCGCGRRMRCRWS